MITGSYTLGEPEIDGRRSITLTFVYPDGSIRTAAGLTDVGTDYDALMADARAGEQAALDMRGA